MAFQSVMLGAFNPLPKIQTHLTTRVAFRAAVASTNVRHVYETKRNKRAICTEESAGKIRVFRVNEYV